MKRRNKGKTNSPVVAPGHCFTVDEAGVGPLDDLKAQVCSIHAGRTTEKQGGDIWSVEGGGAAADGRSAFGDELAGGNN